MFVLTKNRPFKFNICTSVRLADRSRRDKSNNQLWKILVHTRNRQFKCNICTWRLAVRSRPSLQVTYYVPNLEQEIVVLLQVHFVLVFLQVHFVLVLLQVAALTFSPVTNVHLHNMWGGVPMRPQHIGQRRHRFNMRFEC